MYLPSTGPIPRAWTSKLSSKRSGTRDTQSLWHLLSDFLCFCFLICRIGIMRAAYLKCGSENMIIYKKYIAQPLAWNKLSINVSCWCRGSRSLGPLVHRSWIRQILPRSQEWQSLSKAPYSNLGCVHPHSLQRPGTIEHFSSRRFQKVREKILEDPEGESRVPLFWFPNKKAGTEYEGKKEDILEGEEKTSTSGWKGSTGKLVFTELDFKFKMYQRTL